MIAGSRCPRSDCSFWYIITFDIWYLVSDTRDLICHVSSLMSVIWYLMLDLRFHHPVVVECLSLIYDIKSYVTCNLIYLISGYWYRRSDFWVMLYHRFFVYIWSLTCDVCYLMSVLWYLIFAHYYMTLDIWYVRSDMRRLTVDIWHLRSYSSMKEAIFTNSS